MKSGNISRAFIFLIVFFLTATAIIPLNPDFYALALDDPGIESSSAIIYNIEYDTLLYSKNADEKIYPASFVKIMVSILAFEYLQTEKNVPDVTISENVVKKSTGTLLGLKAGEVIPYNELLYAMIVSGANDAANAIAETVAGSIDAFIEKMNLRAKELGALNTYYDNVTGMHSPLMYTTLSDTLLIVRCAYKINDFVVMSSTLSHTLPTTNKSAERKLTSKNLTLNPSTELGYYIENVFGINAGSTTKAGFCAADALEHAGLTDIAIVSGGKINGRSYTHFLDLKRLFDFSQKNFNSKCLIKKGDIVYELPVEMGVDFDHVMLKCVENIDALLPKDAELDKILKIDKDIYVDKLVAPVTAGTEYGKISVYINGNKVGSTSLVAATDIGRSVWLYSLDKINEFFALSWVQTVAAIFVSILILIILLLIIFASIHSAKMNAVTRKAMLADKKVYLHELEIEKTEDAITRKKNAAHRQAIMRRLRNYIRERKREKERRIRLEQLRAKKAAQAMKKRRPPSAYPHSQHNPKSTSHTASSPIHKRNTSGYKPVEHIEGSYSKGQSNSNSAVKKEKYR
ncbi:MAG: D-alanyl-D-alanine carboxypeptidase family protein [Oscillospiraceae bacterium]|nr:D-alanyl-D-alanine carboxypeptidase family protein [Oscillospiraceae bacterium]